MTPQQKWISDPANKEKQKAAQQRWLAKPGIKERLSEYNKNYKRSPAAKERKILLDRISSKRRQKLYPEKNRHWKLKSKYGITLKQWNELFEIQGRCCAICKSETAKWARGHWHTDHNHETGAVRGILCNECNMGLGKFNDNRELVKAALDYLVRELQ